MDGGLSAKGEGTIGIRNCIITHPRVGGGSDMRRRLQVLLLVLDQGDLKKDLLLITKRRKNVPGIET